MDAYFRSPPSWGSAALVLLQLLICVASSEPAPASTDSKIAPLSPARGHYAKLAALDSNPSDTESAIDAERWKTNPSSIERVEKYQPEFFKVPLDTFRLLPCPANSSKQTRAEIDYLLRLQANRTEAEAERAVYFAPWGYSSSIKPGTPEFASQRRNLFYVGRSIGSWFNPNDLPETAEILGRVWRDASHYMWRLKFKYARIRPYNIDAKVKPVAEAPWAAFPSGHSFYSHMLAYLYSDLAPEFSDIFLNDARAIAHSREIIGVHFPSDSEAGRVFAHQFVSRLLESEKFQPEYEKIRKEWRQVRAASPD